MVKVIVTLENDEKEVREYKVDDLIFKPKKKKDKINNIDDEELRELELLEKKRVNHFLMMSKMDNLNRLLKSGERLDELHRNNYKIIQNTGSFVLEWMRYYLQALPRYCRKKQ